ncbi:hypothetical protein D3C80_1640660 [compost metagenome]
MRGQIDNHAARLHGSHHLFGNKLWCRAARDQRRGHDNVHFLCLSGKQRHFRFDKGFRHHFGIAIAAACFFLKVQLEEFCAHTLHLLFDFRAGVEGANDRPQATSRTDSGQASNPSTNDHHFGRGNFTGGGDLAGEETPELVRCLNDSAIACDIGH